MIAQSHNNGKVFCDVLLCFALICFLLAYVYDILYLISDILKNKTLLSKALYFKMLSKYLFITMQI